MNADVEGSGSARELEFTWTRAECLGHVKAWNPRGNLVWKVGALLLAGIAAALGVVGAVVPMLVLFAYLVGADLLMPRQLWRQQNPSLSGTHRYTWTDDSITVEMGASVLTIGAGELTEVLERYGFVVLRLRASRGLTIPVRAFESVEQKRQFLAVARSIARTELSIAARRQDERAARNRRALSIAAFLVVMVVSAMWAMP